MLRLLRVFPVDRLHLEQSQIAFALLRRTHLPQDRVPGPHVETLDLGRRDVDVVGTVQVVPVLAAQEPIALGEDLEDPLAPENDVRIEQVLLDTEDQVLLAHPGEVVDVQLFGHLVKFADRLRFQFGDVH